MLRGMGMTPQELREDVTWTAAARWSVFRFPLLAAVPLAALALLAYWPPLFATRWLATHNREGPDSESTHRVLGMLIFGTIWTVLVGIAAGWTLGWPWGLVTLLLLPAVGIGAAMVAEQRRMGWLAIRRFFMRRLQRRRLGRMRERQRAIAARLNELLEIGAQ
jgi:hypothetical protein